MNEEALKRIKAGGDLKETEKVRKAPVSYRSAGQLPREAEVKELKIYVGKKLSFDVNNTYHTESCSLQIATPHAMQAYVTLIALKTSIWSNQF